MSTSFRSSSSETPASGSAERSAAVSVALPRSPSLWLSMWVAAALAIVLLATRPIELGDTPLYASDIVNHLGKSPVGPGNSLWEFGHLLWRPLGWSLLTLTSPLLSALTNWTPVMQAEFLLIAVSTACSFVSVVLWQAIAMRITGSKGLAFLIAAAMAFSHGFLLYAHSGCAYIPGLACLTGSLYFLLNRKIRTGAVFYALAVLTWLPFILAGAALLLLAASAFENVTDSLAEHFTNLDFRSALRFLVVSAAAVVLVYGLAARARGISSVGEAREWYAAAGHGFSQSMRIVRTATGLPRSLLYLGKDGIQYKRFLHHDPYAPVTLRGVVTASVWKLGAFYLFVVSILHELLRKPRSGWMLLLFSLGAAPVIIFAVVLFEPSSPERYLPTLPFLVLATAWVLRDAAVSRHLTQSFIAAFLLCMIFANGYAFAAPRLWAENTAALARVADLRGRLTSTGIAMIATNQDDLAETLNRLAFDNINRPTPFPLYDIIEPGNVRVLTWRQDVATRTLKAWRSGGEVWVSKRVWSARPAPSWNWTEGDDPRISWKELPQFFAALSTDADSGGPEGFLRLARNEKNLALLEPQASAGSAAR